MRESFNKREDDFESRAEYDDYLEEREDIIFNLVEGNDVKAMEQKIEEYRKANAESIVRNEARKAEEARQRAAATSGAGVDKAGVSGTAAAFEGGQDPEPHQGMEYTAAIPAIEPPTVAPLPLAATTAEGDIQQQAGALSDEAWMRMALASGWSPDMPRRRALEEAFGSLLVGPT
eukprot:scaffold8.g1423.t1